MHNYPDVDVRHRKSGSCHTRKISGINNVINCRFVGFLIVIIMTTPARRRLMRDFKRYVHFKSCHNL